MDIKITDHYKGQLGLRYNQLECDFEYILSYGTYETNYNIKVIEIQNGDELTIRSPDDGTIVHTLIVDFDYEAGKQMNIENGKMYQMVSFQPVNGLQKGLEPTYWFNFFVNGYYADLKRGS